MVYLIDWGIELLIKVATSRLRKFYIIIKIMTPFCIMPVHTGDQRNPLGDIAGLTF